MVRYVTKISGNFVLTGLSIVWSRLKDGHQLRETISAMKAKKVVGY